MKKNIVENGKCSQTFERCNSPQSVKSVNRIHEHEICVALSSTIMDNI